MVEQKFSKITISLPRSLLELADRLARDRSSSRSGLIAQLLKKEEEAGIHALMAEGYQQLGKENRLEAEEALNLTREVVLRGS